MTTVHHGIARTDDYAWLSADNWQQVMHDPAVAAAPISAPISRPRTPTPRRPWPTSKGSAQALFPEMRGRIKEDDSSVPAPDGAFAYATRYERGRRASADRAAAAATAATRRFSSTPIRWPTARPISASAASPTATTTGCIAYSPSTTRAPSISRSASATPRPARTCRPHRRRPPAAPSGRTTARRSSMSGSTTTTGPAKVFRHVVGTDPSGRRPRLRGARSGLLRRRRRDAVAPLHPHRHATTTRRRRSASSTPTTPDGRAAARRRRRDRRGISPSITAATASSS